MRKIYFIQSATGLINIGSTANVSGSLASIDAGCPCDVTLLATCPGGLLAEKELHEIFASHHVKGEWYLPTSEIMEVIEAAKSGRLRLVNDDLRGPTKLEHRKLSTNEKQVALGCLMATAYIPKSKGIYPYLVIRLSKNRDRRILDYCAEELDTWSRPSSFHEDESSYRWFSISHPVWNELSELVYIEGKKKITMKLLDQLTDLGLMTWMIMSNYKLDADSVEIPMTKMGADSVENTVKFFDEIGIAAEVKRSRRGVAIRFEDEGALAFKKLVATRVPSFLR